MLAASKRLKRQFNFRTIFIIKELSFHSAISSSHSLISYSFKFLLHALCWHWIMRNFLLDTKSTTFHVHCQPAHDIFLLFILSLAFRRATMASLGCMRVYSALSIDIWLRLTWCYHYKIASLSDCLSFEYLLYRFIWFTNYPAAHFKVLLWDCMLCSALRCTARKWNR